VKHSEWKPFIFPRCSKLLKFVWYDDPITIEYYKKIEFPRKE